MRSHIARIGIVAVSVLSLAACRDDVKHPMAPAAPNKMIVLGPPPDHSALFPNPEDFVEIVAGDYHTCARKNNGNVYCWGQSQGPLYVTPVVASPTLALQGAWKIDAGFTHTCAIITGGTAYCWGGGNQGQL